MLIAESRLLQDVIAECIQSNFLLIDLSNLMADVTKATDTISMKLEQSVRAFTALQGWRPSRQGGTK